MSKTKSMAGGKSAKASAAKAPKKRQAAKPAAADKPVADASIAPKAKDKKRVHGSFSLPANDYALIGDLKSVLKKAGNPVKKNDLLRAGLRALKAMPDEDLKLAIGALKPEPKAPQKKRQR